MWKTWYLAALLCSVQILTGCTERTILTGETDTAGSAAPAKNRVIVWFVRTTEGGTRFVAVKRPFRGEDRLTAAIQELLDGPTEDELKSGLGSEIPRGTILLAVKHKKGNIELDLSRRFASGGGSDTIEARLSQLERTVESNAEKGDVYLNVEGGRLTMTMGEGIEVPQPINR
jgi:spore germination protein GerM